MRVRVVGLALTLGSAFMFFGACGGSVIPSGPDVDASGNPAANDAGNVLSPDAAIPGITRNGWTWNNMGPQGADLFGVWGSAPNDVWFVGAAGLTLHFDGHAFSAPDSGSGAELRGVWGSGPSDVWAVGRPFYATGPSVILHWNGFAWSLSQSFPSSELYGVWGSAPNEVWAVGGKGFAVHWDGASWTQTPTGTTNDLDGVWTSGPGNAWAVGSVTPVADQGTVLHWNGAAWSPVKLGDGRAQIAHVWGTSSTDVWFAGEIQIDTAQPAIDPSGYLVHWDGVGWGTPFITPSFSSPLRGVFGSGASDVKAVGSGLALSWNGAWSSQVLPGDYEATWESGPKDVWAVGLGGVMAHWDGTAWTELTPPPPARGIYTAVAIWADTPSDAWIAGNGAVSANLLHWDGHVWQPSTIAATSPAYLNFYGLWGSGPSDVWGVGSGPNPKSGRIVHYDGSVWSDAYDQAGNYAFMGVWGASATDVWFSGDNGSLVHWDGTTMTSHAIATSDQLTAVRGTSAKDVWLAGSTNLDLTMRHWDGVTWSVAYKGSGFVSSMFMSSPTDGWAVGWEGAALHWDGTTWAPPQTALVREVGSVWASSASDAWAVGWFGAVLHGDGTAWTPVPITNASFAGISGTSASDVWMVTTEGAILHHP